MKRFVLSALVALSFAFTLGQASAAEAQEVSLVYFKNRTEAGGGFTAQWFSAIVRVRNLGFSKQVTIVGNSGGATWTEYPAGYLKSLPDGTELWRAYGNTGLSRFAVKYMVNGSTYWDNNAGADYRPNMGYDDLLGKNTPIWPTDAYVQTGGGVLVRMLVQNLSFNKQVGALYTHNNWVSSAYVAGAYDIDSGAEEFWRVVMPLSGNTVTFAGYYRLPSLGSEYWANQGGANFFVSCNVSTNQCTLQ